MLTIPSVWRSHVCSVRRLSLGQAQYGAEDRRDHEEQVERRREIAEQGVAQPRRHRVDGCPCGAHQHDHRVHQGQRADRRERHHEVGPRPDRYVEGLPLSEYPARKARRAVEDAVDAGAQQEE